MRTINNFGCVKMGFHGGAVRTYTFESMASSFVSIFLKRRAFHFRFVISRKLQKGMNVILTWTPCYFHTMQSIHARVSWQPTCIHNLNVILYLMHKQLKL